jgi:acetylornithine deacetylase/succinyl-diaminopimelate desuccinylase-like protein
MCILGEPTENKVVLGHFGSLWLRISTRGPFVHTAFSEGRLGENAILRLRDVLDAVVEWIPTWEEANTWRGARGLVNVAALQAGFGWRVSRTPHRADLFLDLRVPPDKPMAVARREALDYVRSLAERFPEHGLEGEVYVTAPGAEIEEGHELVRALDGAHAAVFGAPPERDVVRWFSDASALTRHGVQTVNYGTSSGLPDPVLGENLAIEGLVQTAEVYARAAIDVCGVAA